MMSTNSTVKNTDTPPPITSRMRIEASMAAFDVYSSHSHGSDGYTKISPFVRDLIGTSGVIEMAQELGAYWFIDMVASYMGRVKKLNREDDSQAFFVCRVSKNPLRPDEAVFTIDDGNEGEPFITQEIPYTDLSMNLKTYLQTDGTYWCLMMPSEY